MQKILTSQQKQKKNPQKQEKGNLIYKNFENPNPVGGGLERTPHITSIFQFYCKFPSFH